MHHLDLVDDFRHLVLGDALDGDVGHGFFLSTFEDLRVLPCPNFVEDVVLVHGFFVGAALVWAASPHGYRLRGCPERARCAGAGLRAPVCAFACGLGSGSAPARLIKFEPVRVLWAPLFVEIPPLFVFREPSPSICAAFLAVRAVAACQAGQSSQLITRSPRGFERSHAETSRLVPLSRRVRNLAEWPPARRSYCWLPAARRAPRGEENTG